MDYYERFYRLGILWKIGEMIRKEGKEEDQWSGYISKSKHVSGLTSFKYAEKTRVFDTLEMKRDEGDRMKRKRTLQEKSYKVLNLAFLFGCFQCA